MESTTDLPSDGGIEVTVFGQGNRKFTTGTILGEFTEVLERVTSDYNGFQWEPSRDMLKSNSDLEVSLRFNEPFDTDAEKMNMGVYSKDGLIGGTRLFKDLESDEIESCP